MDCLSEMQPSVSIDSMMGLLYVAGHIIGKSENGDDADGSHFYFSKCFFIDNLNRGRLRLPRNATCQWVIYGNITFNEDVNQCCRKPLR